MNEIVNESRKNLQYAYNCYRFFLETLHNESARNAVTGFHFQNQQQIENYEIELSWAFFCRMEAVLEHFIHEIDTENLVCRGIENLLGQERMKAFNDQEKKGLQLYREIRNVLHHGDGSPASVRNISHLQIEIGEEVQLRATQIANFGRLFDKVICVLANIDFP